MSKENVNENFVNVLKTIGKTAFNASRPALKDAAAKSGKRMFRKAARAGIKKFGKKGTRMMMNTAKAIAKNKEFQDASKQAARDAMQWGMKKTKNAFKKKPVKMQEELVESFSNIVNKSLCNEAWGLVAKAGITGAKAAAKGAAKTVGKHGLKGLKGMKKGQLASNIGSALVDDFKEAGKAALDGSPAGVIRNTFKDEKGNWNFSPTRAIKKGFVGNLKTLDNVFAGGLGQMAYDAATSKSEDCESTVKKSKKKIKK